MKFNQNTLVLFDFDGTITKRDSSFLAFLRFAKGDLRFTIGFVTLLPVYFGYKLGLFTAKFSKEVMMVWFFKGWHIIRFRRYCINFTNQHMNKILRQEVVNIFNWHKSQGHKIVVVSASARQWIEPWCKYNGVDLVATELEIKENRLTGKIAGENCEGKIKVKKIKNFIDISNFDTIYAYGNSKGDEEMLMLADHSCLL